MTHQYELMVILDPEIDERTVAPSLDRFLGVIRNDGGSIENVDIWGKRRLAYEINKKNEGIYAVVNFTANPAATNELDRQLRLSEAVMRTKVLRSEEAVARAASVKADDEKRAARKSAAAAKSAKAAPADAPAPAAKTAEPAKAEEPKAAEPAEPKAAEPAEPKAAEPAEPKAAEPAATASAEPAAAEAEAE